ncbi:MAG: anti-sigma factor RsbA family regulatory protein [Solirubrobacteraceae bacterium]
MVGQKLRARSAAGAVRVALVEDSFRHEALFYSGEEGFLRGTVPFVQDGLHAGEAVLVAVTPTRAKALEAALGDDAANVRFFDMHELARNPARLIPAWRGFLNEHADDDTPVRGIGEPVWPGRSEAELEECVRHESLMNVTFAYGPPWSLLCPYDLDKLDDRQIQDARQTHPAVMLEGISRRSDAYLPLHRAPNVLTGALPDAPPERDELAFTFRGLGAVRSLVSTCADRAGLNENARDDLVLAVNELVTNSVQYGGGGGTLRVWTEPDALVCDVRDRGYIVDPLAGRIAPPIDQHGGRGLWLVNHLCDLVQIRSTPNGTIVRVRAHLR